VEIIDLQDLVDQARENLHVELKDWLDLKDSVCRANLARHIAALANFGGGYIVIGFNDQGDEINSSILTCRDYSRDDISGIVKKYLVPAFQCDVATGKSSLSGQLHPIIRVPGHRETPVCSQADGPQDSKGRPQGIRIATYYMRMPGPASEPILTPDGWRALIHRCVLNERERLIASLSAVIAGRQEHSEISDALLDWHRRSYDRFAAVLASSSNFHWNVPYSSNHYELSYRIERDPSEMLDQNNLLVVLNQANQEVKDVVWTGWSMFYPFSKESIRPYVMPETVEGIETEVLESNLLGQNVGLPDFWRFSARGYATIVRAYREDRQVIDKGPQEVLVPGRWLSPFTLVRDLAEFVRHARAIANLFSSATNIEIRGTWVGLSGRQIGDFESGLDLAGYTSKADKREVHGNWPVSNLKSDWETVVAELASPVTRLFDTFQVKPEWVKAMTPRFRSF